MTQPLWSNSGNVSGILSALSGFLRLLEDVAIDVKHTKQTGKKRCP